MGDSVRDLRGGDEEFVSFLVYVISVNLGITCLSFENWRSVVNATSLNLSSSVVVSTG